MIPCTSMKYVICRALLSNCLRILCYADQKYSNVPNFFQYAEFLKVFQLEQILMQNRKNELRDNLSVVA
jgi:hypothetical protein